MIAKTETGAERRLSPTINEITALWNLIRFWASRTDANHHQAPTNVQLTLQLNHDHEQVAGKKISLTTWTKPYYETSAEAEVKATTRKKSEAEIYADLNYFASHAVGTLANLRTYPDFSPQLPDVKDRFEEIWRLIGDEMSYVTTEMERLKIQPKTHPNFIRHLGYTLVEHARSLAKKGWADTNHTPSVEAIIKLFKEGQRLVRAAEKVDPRQTEIIFSPGDEFIL